MVGNSLKSRETARTCRLQEISTKIAASMLIIGAFTPIETPAQITDVVPFGSAWRYLNPHGIDEDPGTATNVDFIANWTLPSEPGVDGRHFDDTEPILLSNGLELAWQGPAPAPFQWGSGDLSGRVIRGFVGEHAAQTILPTPEPGDKYTHYFRHEFTTSQWYAEMSIEFLVDDGAVFYLNDVELDRQVCCNGPIDRRPVYQDQSLGVGNEDSFTVVVPDVLRNATLIPGRHILAAEVHQNGTADTSDMGFEMRLSGVVVDPTLICDFGGDGVCQVHDLNQLLDWGPLVNGVPTVPDQNERFDLSQDGLIDGTDVELWLRAAALSNGWASPFLPGDTNLDGSVDGIDLTAWADNAFTESLAWHEGDFNSDGFVDGRDFNIWNESKFRSIDMPTIVPESGAFCLTAIAFATTLGFVRHGLAART